MFQSSPGPGAGCCLDTHGTRTPNRSHMFQSSPGPGAGCCVVEPVQELGFDPVSILTRPGGRVLPRRRRRRGGCPTRCFNPHPARGPGAASTHTAPAHQTAHTCFNPHPARGPGAANSPKLLVNGWPGFQSSPGPGAGCCGGNPRSAGHVQLRMACFNPHPARGPGAARCTSPAAPPASTCFNPHPARGPGAAAMARPAGTRACEFQSSPGPGAGCCVTVPFTPIDSLVFQSSPGPGAGCCRSAAVV